LQLTNVDFQVNKSCKILFGVLHTSDVGVPRTGLELVLPAVFLTMFYVSDLSKVFLACVFTIALVMLLASPVDACVCRSCSGRKCPNGEQSFEKCENHSAVPAEECQMGKVVPFQFPEAYSDAGIDWNSCQSVIVAGEWRWLNNWTRAGLECLQKFVASSGPVFPIITEESGFLGPMIVVLSYILVVWSGLRPADCVRDEFGTCLCVGISMLFRAHICTNVGIAIGLVPITGIPPPFLSYGGSFLPVSLSQGVVRHLSLPQNLYARQRC
jgi:rod shape determining protein RodA